MRKITYTAAAFGVALLMSGTAIAQETVANPLAAQSQNQLPDYIVPVGSAVNDPAAYGIQVLGASSVDMSVARPVPRPAAGQQASTVDNQRNASAVVAVQSGTSFDPAAAAQLMVPAPQAATQPVIQPQKTPEMLAYEAALRSLLPLSPDQIQQFKGTLDDTRQAVAKTVGPPPKPVSRSITLTLKPGERSPNVRLFAGNATTLTFYDDTGAAWPVQSVTVGNPNAYQAGTAGEQGKSNMVVVSPLTHHANANNLVVTLVDHPVPIIMTLETGAQEVDYRLDIGIKGKGPMSVPEIISHTTLPATNDSTFQKFLDDSIPDGARKMKTSNRDVDAWTYNDLVYVRSHLKLLSPAYIGSVRNVSGTSVYQLVDAPVLLFSQDGRMISVSVNF